MNRYGCFVWATITEGFLIDSKVLELKENIVQTINPKDKARNSKQTPRKSSQIRTAYRLSKQSVYSDLPRMPHLRRQEKLGYPLIRVPAK